MDCKSTEMIWLVTLIGNESKASTRADAACDIQQLYKQGRFPVPTSVLLGLQEGQRYGADLSLTA